MGNINNRFLEEYKRLDKICREMYRVEKGVTAYINDMKCVPPYESRTISNWNADLQQLIALRDLRNRLAHEYGTLDKEMCSLSQIIWLDEFYGRILQRTDPIALLAKSKLRKQAEMPRENKNNVSDSDAKLEGRRGSCRKFGYDEERDPFGAVLVVFTILASVYVVVMAILHLFL